MRYTIEITQHTEINSMEEQRVFGTDIPKICDTFGIKPDKDWQDKEYVSMMIPGKKRIDTVVYKQGIDTLNLSEIIMIINKPKVKEGGE